MKPRFCSRARTREGPVSDLGSGERTKRRSSGRTAVGHDGDGPCFGQEQRALMPPVTRKHERSKCNPHNAGEGTTPYQ